MNMSDENKQKLYDAISDPIMDKRVEVKMENKLFTHHEIDELLYKLERTIWNNVKRTLKVKD